MSKHIIAEIVLSDWADVACVMRIIRLQRSVEKLAYVVLKDE